MPDTAQQPKIAVKRADGTIVKMTLDEFRAYQKQKESNTPTPSAAPVPLSPGEVASPNVQPVATPSVPSNLPMVEPTQSLSTTTPTIVGEVMKQIESIPEETEKVEEKKEVLPIQEPQNIQLESKVETQTEEPEIKEEVAVPNEPTIQIAPVSTEEIQKQIKKEEFTSPLEEKIEESTTAHTPVSDANDAFTKQIIESLPFSPKKDIQGRLYALVLSRVKEIRNDDQVRENAMLSIQGGGLGLNSDQTESLLRSIQSVVKKTSAVPPLPSAQARLTPISPQKATTSPGTLKPINKPSSVDAKKMLSSLIAEESMQAQIKLKAQNAAPITAIKPQSLKMEGGKVAMHDVVSPQVKRSIGPIDEMMNFSLVDFRRLGNNPQDCADALIQKFNVLKKESYLLFLNGKAAWMKSPLYTQYLTILEQSLVQNKPLNLLFVSPPKEALSLEEVKEMVRVSQSLNV